MARVNRRGSIVAALAVLGIIIAGGREARAELLNVAKGGIVQVGGGGAGTDPAYTYQFDITLTGTINGLLSGKPTSITFDNLVGVYPLDFANSAPPGWVYTSVLTGLSGSPYGLVATSDVTWTYLGLPSISSTGSTPLNLGIFSVTTEANLPGGYPGEVTNAVNYNFSLDGGPTAGGSSGSGNSGALQPGGILVPEPSTAIAPLTALLGLPLVMMLKRRALRRSQRAA